MSGGQGAGEALAGALTAALKGSGLTGAYEGRPVQASLPYALVEAGPERDWSHKSGRGRETRLAITIRDGGERPDRARRLMRAAEQAAAALPRTCGGWRIVSLLFLGSRLIAERSGQWAGLIEYRARLLEDNEGGEGA